MPEKKEEKKEKDPKKKSSGDKSKPRAKGKKKGKRAVTYKDKQKVYKFNVSKAGQVKGKDAATAMLIAEISKLRSAEALAERQKGEQSVKERNEEQAKIREQQNRVAKVYEKLFENAPQFKRQLPEIQKNISGVKDVLVGQGMPEEEAEARAAAEVLKTFQDNYEKQQKLDTLEFIKRGYSKKAAEDLSKLYQSYKQATTNEEAQPISEQMEQIIVEELKKNPKFTPSDIDDFLDKVITKDRYETIRFVSIKEPLPEVVMLTQPGNLPEFPKTREDLEQERLEAQQKRDYEALHWESLKDIQLKQREDQKQINSLKQRFVELGHQKPAAQAIAEVYYYWLNEDDPDAKKDYEKELKKVLKKELTKESRLSKSELQEWLDYVNQDLGELEKLSIREPVTPTAASLPISGEKRDVKEQETSTALVVREQQPEQGAEKRTKISGPIPEAFQPEAPPSFGEKEPEGWEEEWERFQRPPGYQPLQGSLIPGSGINPQEEKEEFPPVVNPELIPSPILPKKKVPTTLESFIPKAKETSLEGAGIVARPQAPGFIGPEMPPLYASPEIEQYRRKEPEIEPLSMPPPVLGATSGDLGSLIRGGGGGVSFESETALVPVKEKKKIGSRTKGATSTALTPYDPNIPTMLPSAFEDPRVRSAPVISRSEQTGLIVYEENPFLSGFKRREFEESYRTRQERKDDLRPKKVSAVEPPPEMLVPEPEEQSIVEDPFVFYPEGSQQGLFSNLFKFFY